MIRLISRLKEFAADKPDKPAYVDAATGAKLTWQALQHRTDILREQLRSFFPAGSVVLIQCPNTSEFPIAFLATLAANLIAFPISPDSPELEVKSIAERAGATGIITSEAVTPLPHVTEVSTPISSGLMLLSSGSTGAPKIVCRSAESIDAVCDQMCREIGITETDRVLATVPLCHSYGIEHGLLAPVWAGATVYLCRGLDLPLIQKTLVESRITLLPAVPSMYEMLGNLIETGQRYPDLRTAYSAGAPLPAAVAERFHQCCGIQIGQLFGATEIGSVTFANPQHPYFESASVGLPMPGVKIKVEDHAVYISAPSMFTGYLGEPSPITDGFYPTGDIGHVDRHGNLFITGRTKLLIDIGGLKVNPLEVEQVLLKHPTVADCAVIPVRQSETILRLKAIVTPRPNQSIDIVELRRFARQHLTSYKVPRLFEVRDQLPRTETGKILRQMVQA